MTTDNATPSPSTSFGDYFEKRLEAMSKGELDALMVGRSPAELRRDLEAEYYLGIHVVPLTP